jgi:hypothetical protein
MFNSMMDVVINCTSNAMISVRAATRWVNVEQMMLRSVDVLPGQVRKLEFLFAEAIARGCTHVVTLGGTVSNRNNETPTI